MSSASSSLSSIINTRSVTLPHTARGAVHDQPVHAQATHCLSELFEVHWFYDVAVRTETVALHEIALLGRGSQDDDGEQSCPIITSDSAQYLESVNARQLQVQQHNLRHGL